MDDFKSVVSYKTYEYGRVKVKLAEMLEAKGIIRNRLRALTGVKYEIGG